jgi:S1-C subfamily serine protease
MDIKDLNRSQFLLLLMLIMFVSSITTAIVTVTLMDQSPKAGVTNTINQVIERVIPGATTTIVKIVKEESPTVSEGEQIVKAMGSVSPFVVGLKTETDSGVSNLGTGFVVRNDIVATALKNLPEGVKTVSIVKRDVNIPGEVVSRDSNNNIALIRFVATSTLAVDSLVFAKTAPASGQTSVSLAYVENNSPEIMIGIVMGVVNATSTSTPDVSSEVIRTGSIIGDNIGGPVINIFGEVMGIGISRGYALSAGTLQALVDQIK